MIKINCDMINIEKKHVVYVRENITPRFLDKYEKQSYQLKIYLDSFIAKDKNALSEQLIELCLSKNLSDMIDSEKNIRETVDKNLVDNGDKQLSTNEIKKFWDDVLNYDGFGRGIKKGKFSVTWNRHLFVEMTGVKVCPYCNRNYITSYVEDGEYDNQDAIRTTASVDHYYPKAQFPFLQMNIYNMVPSCTICNSYTKGAKTLKHLNPYFDEGNISFELEFNTLDDLYLNMTGKSHIIISGKDQKSKKSIEAFNLSKVYQSHGTIVEEIQQKIMDYENFEEDYYKKLLGNIDVGIDNIHENWFDFTSKDEGDEPLIKLKKDIYKQISG